MATLKISDLSVGDWVRYKGKECTIAAIYMAAEGYPHDVALTCQGFCYGCAYIDHLEPIPITAEMLEKNGFEENCGRWYNSDAIIEFEQYKDGWCRTINSGEYDVYFIKYIHQLQHALRLAGVDKEINL